MRTRVSPLSVLLLSLFVIVAPALPVTSRLTVKKVFTPQDYELWNSIVTPVLSDDGRWVAYSLTQARGARELVVRAADQGVELRVPQGDSAEFSGDSDFAVFTITPNLGIMKLPVGVVTKIPQVASFSLPRSGKTLAYRVVRHAAADAPAVNARRGSSAPLVLRDLPSGEEVTIDDVGEFIFDNNGRYLAYTIVSADHERNGVFVRHLTDRRVTALVQGVGRYRNLRFDHAGMQLAFISDRDSRDKAHPRYSLYLSAAPFLSAEAVVPADALTGDLAIAGEAPVKFTRLNNAVTFGIAGRSKQTAEHQTATSKLATPQAPQEGAKFELWHWKAMQPLLQGEVDIPLSSGFFGFDQQGAYLVVYHISERRWVQLGQKEHPKVLLTDDARYAVGLKQDVGRDWRNLFSNRPYRADMFLVDAHTRKSKLLQRIFQPDQLRASLRREMDATNVFDLSHFALSPNSRYLAYFDENRWWSVELANGTRRDLTGTLLSIVRFNRQGPHNPASQSHFNGPFGLAGWTEHGRLLVYSQHDSWEIDPAGAAEPRNLTVIGKKENTVFRLWEDPFHAVAAGSDLPRHGAFIDARLPLLLIARHPDSGASSIWRGNLAAGTAPKLLLKADKLLTPLAKTQDAARYLLTMERFSEYPDLWVGSGFERPQRISNVNPQQKAYRGSVCEFVNFISDYGNPLKGRLCKPDDFDPARKYPMLVTIYQTSAQNLHLYAEPQLLQGAPDGTQNWARGVSEEFLYFVPDIEVTAPYAAQSAVAAVVPAVQSVINMGFVNPRRIALSGHSFGGFEVNFIITQTNMFRCAISGAGIANMLSFYGTTAHGPGFTEYHHPKLGGSPWERPLTYFANSAVLFADRVQTPLLIMHNDQDTAVPLGQSQEFFTALHRNGKEVYMFNYLGEEHVLTVHANRLDWEQRVYEYLNHCLKDAPRPQWMSVDP